MSRHSINVYLDTLGCRLNEAELQTWSREFIDGGHRVVSHPGEAHLLVLNTCAVTGEAARKSRQFVRRLHRENPEARVVVTGCFAELEPTKAGDLPGVDLVVGNHDKDALVERVLDELDFASMPELATAPDSHPAFRSTRTRAFIKVQDGCRHRCTYCIVTVARGEERSRSVADLLDEVNALVDAGTREVVLTGVHLGGYGHDLGTDLKTLVSAVLTETDIDRVRLSSLEPWDLPPDFFELWRHPRLMPHLHLPLQSGSDAVLKRMGRRCDVLHFTSLVAAARRAIPGLTVTTDLIVGFPGETEAEWADTMSAVERIGFGHMHIFSFSPRAGTGAALHRRPVTREVKRERSAELHELAQRMKREHLAQFVGRESNVLWESRTGSGWVGYAENYLRALHRDVADGSLANTISPVRFTALDDEGMVAEILDGIASPA
jgi:threonylcarbamoyladenosine tRNA methylthiotransferase MtaB